MAKFTDILSAFIILFNIILACHLIQATEEQQVIYDELWKRVGGKTAALSSVETLNKLKALLEPPFGDVEQQQSIKYLVDVHEAKVARCNRADLAEMSRVKSYNELELYKSIYIYMKYCYRKQLTLCLHDLHTEVQQLSSETGLEWSMLEKWVKTTKSWGHERGIIALINTVEPNFKDPGYGLREKAFETRAIKRFESVVMEMCNKLTSKLSPLLEAYNDVVEKGLRGYLKDKTITWMEGTILCREVQNDKQHYIDGFLQRLKKNMMFII